MSTSLHRLLIVVCWSLASGTVLANPTMPVEELSAVVTGDTNVLLRYVSSSTFPPSIGTHGTSQSDWFTTDETYSKNIGSGITFTKAYEFLCDCHVPTGSSLTYREIASKVSVTVTPVPNLSNANLCDARCASSDRRATGTTTPGSSSGGGSVSGESTGGTSGTNGGDSTENHDANGGACSLSRNGGSAALCMVLVLGLLALGWRRRQ